VRRILAAAVLALACQAKCYSARFAAGLFNEAVSMWTFQYYLNNATRAIVTYAERMWRDSTFGGFLVAARKRGSSHDDSRRGRTCKRCASR